MNNHIHIPVGLDAKYNPGKYATSQSLDYIQPSMVIDQTDVTEAKNKLTALENTQAVTVQSMNNHVEECKKIMQSIAQLEKELVSRAGMPAQTNEYNMSPFVRDLLKSDCPTLFAGSTETINEEISRNKRQLIDHAKSIDECKKTIDGLASPLNEARLNFIMAENKFLRAAVDLPGRYQSGDEIVYNFMVDTMTDNTIPY